MIITKAYRGDQGLSQAFLTRTSARFINYPYSFLNMVIYIKIDLVTPIAYYCRFAFSFIKYHCK